MGLIPTLCSLGEYRADSSDSRESKTVNSSPSNNCCRGLRCVVFGAVQQQVPPQPEAGSALIGLFPGSHWCSQCCLLGTPLWDTHPSSCCTVLCISMLLRLFLFFPKDPSIKSKAMATYPTSCCFDSLECSAAQCAAQEAPSAGTI